MKIPNNEHIWAWNTLSYFIVNKKLYCCRCQSHTWLSAEAGILGLNADHNCYFPTFQHPKPKFIASKWAWTGSACSGALLFGEAPGTIHNWPTIGHHKLTCLTRPRTARLGALQSKSLVCLRTNDPQAIFLAMSVSSIAHSGLLGIDFLPSACSSFSRGNSFWLSISRGQTSTLWKCKWPGGLSCHQLYSGRKRPLGRICRSYQGLCGD